MRIQPQMKLSLIRRTLTTNYELKSRDIFIKMEGSNNNFQKILLLLDCLLGKRNSGKNLGLYFLGKQLEI